ncbi:uncharacterized protein [Montipora capricornis]|uniref:uncharacterized protein n=1 Tax=Montipora capricornis TaxID=246305 RepID=UPI0035F1ED06
MLKSKKAKPTHKHLHATATVDGIEEWGNLATCVMTTYFIFLLWRFVSIALYSVYATDCFLRAKLATLRCENFTKFPDPTVFEIAWQSTSAINGFIAIAILFKLPEFPGFTVIGLRLIRLARFWSFFFQLIVVMTYNIILFFHEHLLESAVIEVGFIFDEMTIWMVVCLWNFVPAPKNKSFDRCPGLLIAYYCTLIVFFLENFFLFLLMTSQAALDVTGIHEFENRSKGLQALGIVLNATEATFYFAVMKFMWNKLFECNSEAQDLLKRETI